MQNTALRTLFTFFIFSFFTAPLIAQDTKKVSPIHLQIKRMNDTYIDVYHNPPIGTKPLPLIIFCQGSGYDSNTEGFLRILSRFNHQAVGVAIEKQGVNLGDKGDRLSDQYKQHNTVSNRLYDYLRVFQYLKVHTSWWNGEVYVIGGSEGGLLAEMIASYYPNVKAVAILSFGGGLSFGEAWPISSGLQKKVAGGNALEIEKEIRTVTDSLRYIRAHSTYLKSYSGEDNTYAWWASIMDLRLETTLLDLEIPIYLAQGTEDIMAPPASAQKLHENFIKNGKTNLFYKEYEGCDHGFTDKNGQSHLVEVIITSIQWMLDKK